jgi:5-methylcytosine-specific restriction endonuclease McrA
VIRFRDKDPLRRQAPTRQPTKNWSLHKDDLKIDFNSYCGYCHSYDGYRHTYFEVDHFVPKDLIIKNKWLISLTEYSNLVYSCKFCNNAKLNKWPSNSSTKYCHYGKGYIDPCHVDFNKQFYRTNRGAIRGKTRLGKWMYKEAFKFDQREPGIILLWNVNILRLVIEELISKLNRCKYGSTRYKAIKTKLDKFGLKYFLIHKELMEYYDQF